MWNLQLLDADLLDISKSKFRRNNEIFRKKSVSNLYLEPRKLLELHQPCVSGIKLSLEDKRIYSLDDQVH